MKHAVVKFSISNQDLFFYFILELQCCVGLDCDFCTLKYLLKLIFICLKIGGFFYVKLTPQSLLVLKCINIFLKFIHHYSTYLIVPSGKMSLSVVKYIRFGLLRMELITQMAAVMPSVARLPSRGRSGLIMATYLFKTKGENKAIVLLFLKICIVS